MLHHPCRLAALARARRWPRHILAAGRPQLLEDGEEDLKESQVGVQTFGPPDKDRPSQVLVLLDLLRRLRYPDMAGITAEDLTNGFDMVGKVPGTPWLSMLTKLGRRFKVRGSVGPAVLSTTGFAEGDALSCLAMTLVNIGFHHAVANATVGPSQAISYVDNWETVSNSVPALLGAHEARQAFTEAWDLPIDVNKTVAWSTTAGGRNALRELGFEVSLGFRDLGAHLQPSRCHRNATQIVRIRSLDSKWLRLQASLAPRGQKVRALSVAAWPAALHAVSAVSVGECHFRSLRSSAMKAVGLKAPGASPLLQLSLIEYPTADPFFFALRSSFFDACALAGEAALAPLLDLAVDQTRTCPGPAGVLLVRANAAAIAWDVAAQTFVDSLGPLPAWRLSSSELQLRLARSWQQVVQDRLSHRQSFLGLDTADPHLTRLLLKSFPLPERNLLVLSLNGTFFTNDSLQHVGSDCDPACPFCGVRDSVKHRILHCDHFADCRRQCQLSDVTLRALPEAQQLHAWAIQLPGLTAVQQILVQLPLDFHSFAPFPDLADYDIFTDGSCLQPNVPALRLASWASCLALPGFPARSLRLCRGLVPGLLQSAFRGEVCAVVSAALFCWRVRKPVRVWCDCLGVVLRLRSLLEGSWRPGPRSKHADLWTLVLNILDGVSPLLSIHKVASHLDPLAEESFSDEWCAEHNNFVDAEAAAAQELRSLEFWGLWQQLQRDHQREWHVAREVMKLHVAIGQRATRTRPVLVPRLLQPVSLPGTPPFSFGDLSPDGRAKLAHRYSSRFLDAFEAWAGQIGQEPNTFRWVSNVQLFLAFCMDSNFPPPIFRSGAWCQTDLMVNGNLIQVTLGQRIRWWTQILSAYTRLSGTRWRSTETRPHSAALQVRLACYPLVFSDAVHARVEAFLTRHLPDGVVCQHSRTWLQCPVPTRDWDQ